MTTELASNGAGYVDALSWNRVRIETVGDSIKIFINDASFCDVTDSSIQSGRVALEALFCQAQFDNVKVTDLLNSQKSTADNFNVIDNDGAFGNQWRNTYGDRLLQQPDGHALIERANGQRDIFRKHYLYDVVDEQGVLSTYKVNTNAYRGFNVTAPDNVVYVYKLKVGRPISRINLDGSHDHFNSRGMLFRQVSASGQETTVNPAVPQFDLPVLDHDGVRWLLQDTNGTQTILPDPIDLHNPDPSDPNPPTPIGPEYIPLTLIHETLIKQSNGDFTLTDKHGNMKTFSPDGDLIKVQDRIGNGVTIGYQDLPATVRPHVKVDHALILDNFDDGLMGFNSLNLPVDDDGTLVSETLVNGGIELEWNNTVGDWTSDMSQGLAYTDLSSYTHLTMQLSGAAGGEDFHIKMEAEDGSWFVVLNNYVAMTTDVQTVEIPLGHFAGINRSKVKSISISFVAQASGKVWMDNLGFVANTAPNDPINYTVRRPVSITDSSNRATTLMYSANGKVNQVASPSGAFYFYNYDADGNLVSSTGSRGYTRAYEYNANRTLKKYTSREGHEYHFTYAYNNRCLSQLDPLGNLTTFTYLWNLTEVRNDDGEMWTYQIDEHSNQVISIIDPFGNAINWELDALTYQINQTIDKNGNPTTYTYDDLGNTLTVTDALLKTTTFTYDPVYSLIETVENARGYTTTFNRNANGTIDSVTNHLSHATDFTYDMYGDRLATTNPLGHTWTITRDTYGNILTQADPFGHTWNYSYNVVGEIISVTDPRTHTTLVLRDLGGLITSVSDPFQNVTSYEYDGDRQPGTLVTQYEYNGIGELIKVTDALGDESEFVYDGKNFMQFLQADLTQVTDANSHTTINTFDALGRLLATQDHEGGVTQYTYDAGDRLTAVMDANSNITQYTWDEVDNLRATTYPDGTTHFMAYDAVGNMISETTRKGDEFEYKYDELDRVFERPFLGTEFTYDVASRLVAAEDSLSVTPAIFTYDKANRLVNVADQRGRTVAYEYDESGNRTKMTYPDGSELTYEYDKKNRMTDIHDLTDSGNYQFVYDNNDRRTLLTYPNGVTTSYQYDFVHRLISTINRDPAAAILSQFDYMTDRTGNRVSRFTNHGFDTYAYDTIDRLKAVNYDSGNRHVDYVLDPVGNRISMSDDGNVTGYTVNALNQYTSVGGVAHTYDGNGSLASNGTSSFAYDRYNRLCDVTIGATSVSNAYDFFGRRFQQSASGASTYFVHDGDEVIVDQNSDGTTIRKYIYGPGIDELLAIKPGAITHALEFNGTDSYVTVPDDPSIKNNPNMTVAFWVKDLKGSGQINRILGKGYGTARDLDYASIFWSNDHLWGYQMVDGGGHNLAQHAGVDRSDWIHFAKTLEPEPGGGFTSKLYFNGQLQNTRTVSYTNLELSTYPLKLGWWAGGYFKGQLDDVAIYHRTLTESDIQALMTNGPSDLTEVDLKAYYSFDGGTVDFQGGTVLDQSPHGNHGQIVGGVEQVARATHYITRDGLNSTSEATDSAGSVIESYRYDVYGLPTIIDSLGNTLAASAINNRYLYTGREWEPETGLYYYRARHYDPNLGRFLQPDPIGYASGMNLYQYVSSNPIGGFDPFGLYDIEWKGDWSNSQKAKITNSLSRVRARSVELMGQVEGAAGKMSSSVFGKSGHAELGSRLNAIIGGIDGSQNLELYHQRGGPDDFAGTRTGPILLYDANITFYDRYGWMSRTSSSMDVLMLHELTHVHEGPIDFDNTDFLVDPFNIQKLMFLDLEKLPAYQKILEIARKQVQNTDGPDRCP